MSDGKSMKQEYQNILNCLKSAIGLLDFEQNLQLRKDVIFICDYIANPSFRIAVFAPFNYGKSTLLNAILGNRTLPIDLIPTTGAAIIIQYGNELSTRLTMVDGREINESGTEVLKRFAILDNDRCMRSDVASIQVFCPHPFLHGVELLDLPGTNDKEAQDMLVRDQLLKADLVVQVLDARKLMTLGEREHLRDWLIDRGIKTIVFVVNFLNLLEPSEQKEVSNRLRSVAESFRSDLPNGISNLYRVDALPALRARLKGDMSAVHSTGIATFETALQTIVAAQQQQIADKRLPRLVAIATQVKHALQVKAQAIATDLEAESSKHNARNEIKQKAEELIKQGFKASISKLESWLYLPTLLELYQSELAAALQQGEFETWDRSFKKALLEHQQAVGQWINQACDFFDRNQPAELFISFPSHPEVFLPNQPTPLKSSGELPVAIATGLGWFLGGPIGAAVVGSATYLLNRNEEKPESSVSYLDQVSQAYADAATDYLTRFSTQAISTLQQYEKTAEKVISFTLTEQSMHTSQHHQLLLLHSLLNNLNQELKLLSTSSV